MASPWVTPTPQRPPIERPWTGMVLLAAVPLLSLILIRMLWSGSSLWFLAVGIILLGAAAVVFLARRSNEQQYGRPTLAQEPNRLPLVLMGLGVLFLALLVLPNFSGDDDDSSPSLQLQEQQPSSGLTSQVSGINQQPQQQQQPTAQQQNQSRTLGSADTTVQESPRQAVPVQPSSQEPPASDADTVLEGSQTYVVADGDTLWDIADEFGVTVDAIVEANDLDNPADIQIDQELIIPPPSEEPADEEAAAPVEEDTTAADDTIPVDGQ